MSTFQEFTDQLRSAISLSDSSHGFLGLAQSELAEARITWECVLDGTADDAAAQAVARAGEAHAVLDGLLQSVAAAQALLLDYLTSIGAERAVGAALTSTLSSSMPVVADRHSPDWATHEDGSRYPAAASWAVSMLPTRVRGRKQRTVGRAKINGRLIPAPFSSQPDSWADTAGERLRERGVPDYLRFHVEMKLVALMIDTRATTAEVAINHAPCGSEPGTFGGCHDNLETVLPTGYTLTVYGSTADGQPFTRTYQGSADA